MELNKLLTIILIAFSTNIYAGEKSDKIKALMETMGLNEMWSQQIQMGKENNKKIGQQLIDQMLAQLNPSEEFKNRFESAFNNFRSKINITVTSNEMVEIWSSYYGPEFTNDELDRLIAFYTSPLGQKDIKVTQSSMVSFTTHLQQKNSIIMKKAIKVYIDDLKIIAKKCNCQKKVITNHST